MARHIASPLSMFAAPTISRWPDLKAMEYPSQNERVWAWDGQRFHLVVFQWTEPGGHIHEGRWKDSTGQNLTGIRTWVSTTQCPYGPPHPPKG